MNYTTEVLEYLTKIKGMFKVEDSLSFTKRHEDDCLVLDYLSKIISTCTKFVLPNDGEVGIKDLSIEVLNMVRLPFNSMSFEYKESISGLKHLILIQSAPEWAKGMPKSFDSSTCSDPDDLALSVISQHEEVDGWGPPGVIWKITREQLLTSTYSAPNIRIKGTLISALPGYRKQVEEENGLSFEGMTQELLDSAMPCVITSLKAIACINARNVGIVTLPAPTGFSAKWRAQKKKPPFFEYKVLDIFLGAINSRPSDPIKLRKQLDSILEASNVRLHARRGHFKVRKTGIFWWSPHMAGRRDKGVVVNDYDVKMDKAA